MTTISKKTAQSSGQTVQEDAFDLNSWMAVLDKKSLSVEDLALLLKGLQEHPEWVNQRGSFHKTPLMNATDRGWIDVVQALIQAGADVNAQNCYGWTALMYASSQGNEKVIQALLEAGVDVNAQNCYGTTALMWASYYGHVKVAQLLIQAGAYLNLQDENGETVLMHASCKGYLEVVQQLIQQGANPFVRNDQQQTALELAKQSGRDNVVCYLEAYADQKTLSQAIQDKDPTSLSLRSKDVESPNSSKKIRL